MSVNAEALTELLIRERRPLLRFLARYLDRASCEDTYQALYFKMATVSGDPPIEDKQGYLYRAAYHQALNQVRSESRARNVLDEAARLLAETEIPDTEAVVIAQAELTGVVRTIEALPEPTRRIFELNRYDGLTQQQIARELGISISTVEKHVRRALARLKPDAGCGP